MIDLIVFIILLLLFIRTVNYLLPRIMNWTINKLDNIEHTLISYFKSKFKINKSINKYYDVDETIMNHREKLFGQQQNNNMDTTPTTVIHYHQKELITNYEEYFYNILLELENELDIRIQAQVNLRTIIDKNSTNKYKYKYAGELFRNIDFGIFTKDCKKVLLLIEINDKTHKFKKRKERDLKVDEICLKAGIKLIKFYSNYPNEKEYVKNRIKKELDLNN